MTGLAMKKEMDGEMEPVRLDFKLEEIGEEAGLDVVLTRPFGFFFGEADDIKGAGDVAVDVHLAKTGDEVFASGSAAVTVTMQCGRCLAEFEHRIEAVVEAPFFPRLPKEGKTDEEEEDEGDINYHDGETVDVFPVLHDQLILALPLKPLCREDCKGLCPRCGEDLNVKECGCPKGSPGSPFEELKKLKERL